MLRRPHWAGELVVVVCLLVVYDRVAALARVRIDSAVEHGRALLAWSGGLEKTADHWLAGVSWLQAPASYYYDLAHIDVTVAVLLLCYWRAPDVYRKGRNALIAINLVGLTTFVLYPVAPPRLLPGSGFVDIVAGSGTWGAWEAGGGIADRANELASMPSLHAAWAIWVALTVTAMTGNRWLRGLAWTHVALTFVVVIVTGNHYVIDVIAGVATTAAAWAVVPRLALRRVQAPVVTAIAD
jgi:hypothetical protein